MMSKKKPGHRKRKKARMEARKKRFVGRKGYGEEFRRKAVEMVRGRNGSLSEVAELLGVGVGTLYKWKRQADIDGGFIETDELTTTERQELRQLRREVEDLRMANDLLKKLRTLSEEQE